MPAARAAPHAAGRGSEAVPLARAPRFRPGEAGMQGRARGVGIVLRPATPLRALGLGRAGPAPLGALPACVSSGAARPPAGPRSGGAAGARAGSGGSGGPCCGEQHTGSSWGLAGERPNCEQGFKQWPVGMV